MTTRAKPGASWEAACRHLFRHLDDARELRRNPIVGYRFGGRGGRLGLADALAVAAIRAEVLAAIDDDFASAVVRGGDDRAHRQRKIILSHVLEKRDPDAIAAELNLSRRQFYRERRNACNRIARMLTTQSSTRSRSLSVYDAYQIAISAAKRFIAACQSERGLNLLDDIARVSVNPVRQVEAHMAVAERMAEWLQFDAAKRRVACAKRLLRDSQSELPDEVRSLCDSEIAAARAHIASNEGRSDEARRLIRGAVRALDYSYRSDERLRELQIDLYLRAAEHAHESGYFVDARKRLTAAQVLLETLSNPPPLQKARLAQLAGHILTAKRASATTSEAVSDVLRSAQTFAQRNGLTATAIEATISLSLHYAYGAGDTATALREMDPLLQIAPQVSDRAYTGLIYLSIGMVRLAAGEYRAALGDFAIAARRGCLSPALNGGLHVETARAYIGTGDFDRAIEFANRAQSMGLTTKNLRLQSGALRASAIGHFKKREIMEAREQIVAAVEKSERFGSDYGIARAYMDCSIITGEDSYARRSRALSRHGGQIG